MVWAGLVFPLVVSSGYDLLVTPETGTVLDMGALGCHEFVGNPLNTFDFGGSIGTKNVGIVDTIVRRNTGHTLTSATDSFTTTIDILAVSLKSVSPIDLGFGPSIYYATLHPGAPNNGSMTIKGDQTWFSNFDIKIDLHRGSPTGPVDSGPDGIAKSFEVKEAENAPWFSEPGPHYVKIEGVNDDHFFVGLSLHQDPIPGCTTHTVIDQSFVPEPSTGLLLLAGGLAVVWRTRRSRVAA
jgi:hypothetical protein